MARLILALIVVVTVLALLEAKSVDKKAKRKAKRCARNIKAFEACLSKGYKSDGCISGDGTLEKKGLKKCKRLAKKAKKCGHTCKKPEPEPEPEPEVKPPPGIKLPFDMNCRRTGFDFWGADIRNFKAESFEQCAMTCAEEAGCESFTSRHSDNYCWLKNKRGGATGPTPNGGLSSMNLHCDRSRVDSSCQRDNMDFWGADLRNFVSQSLEDCALHCRDTEDCQSFTLRKSDNYCWLKKKRGGQSGPSPNNALVSMNINCAAPGFDPADRRCAMDNYDFWGADLRNFKSSGYENCHTSCFDAADCVSFTMRKSDNYCWMKTKQGGEHGPSVVNGLISANMEC